MTFDVTDTTLNLKLQNLCLTFAQVVADATDDLTVRNLVDLPGQVFMYAVEEEWLAEPPTPKGATGLVPLGGCRVTAQYRDAFIRRLAPRMDILWEIAEGTKGDNQPTATKAADLIRRWQDQTGDTMETLSEQAGVSVPTIYRIVTGKFSYKKHRESLKAIAAVIGCDWKDLICE